MKNILFSLLGMVLLIAFGGITTINAQCTNPAYVEGGPYAGASVVSNGGKDYTCNVPGWCNGAAWAYEPGAGAHWGSAWSLTADPCAGGGGGGGGGGGSDFYSCPTVNTWTNNPADCGGAAIAAAGVPSTTDNAYVRDDWFNSVYAYSLPNLAWGMDGGVFFSAKPLKLILQNGGRVVFNTTSYAGLPGAFSLVTEAGGTFASYTSFNTIANVVNDGAIHLFGAVTNGNNIAGGGSICYNGNFENSTLGGSINGVFVSASQAVLDAGYFTGTGFGGKCGSSGALPVELIDFNAAKFDEHIALNWTTGSEINSSHFEVLRSYEGSVWETVDYVNAQGNTSQVSHYTTIDDRFSGRHKQVYYKLKIVDIDGSHFYSVIRRVGLEGNQDLFVFDNGTDVVVNIQSESKGIFKILDMNGREVFRENVSQSSNLLISKSLFVGSGIYVASFLSGSAVSNQKVFID